ncbi:MAG TPA: hypothetical protein VGC31_02360 [Paenirhodobacter sp.]
MKSIWIAAALIGPAPAMAALSGYYDSAAQISAITTSAPVADALKQRPVEGIKAIGTRPDGKIEWRIWGKGCSISVLLAPVAPQGMGRTDYRVSDLGRCR